MAGLKEIKRRLVSVRNTKKITYAMKLVAAAKLRKAQDSVTRSRAYSDSLKDLLAELSAERGALDFEHPLMEPRENVQKVRLLAIGGSRGLCGGYNSNINKKIDAFYREQSDKGIEVESVLVSRKPAEYFRRLNRRYLASYETLPEDANLWPIDDICKELEHDFTRGEVDRVYMIYTKFRSALSMDVMLEKILPMDSGVTQEGAHESAPAAEGVTLFEPSPLELFSELVPRILRARVRQACLDAKASEYGSRMTAMEAATKNAGDLIHRLTLTANKLRQSQITSQLLDILNGAEALT
ncbi:MAG: ATP synthase F1 subunit gamma [Deltaproteobacteria bacterium]|nr:ATP synthase F1 subunit gamma [Deltaproteobacteria bacterium]